MEAIHGAVDVPGMYASDRDKYPYGAIGLAASATYRAAYLWKVDRVTYDKENRPVAKKAFNPQTGRFSTKDVEFSIANYGSKTAGAAASARALPIKSLDTVVRLARGFQQASLRVQTKRSAEKSGEVDFASLVDVSR